ncbi:MAG: hypothetical protein ACRDHD_07890 [Candidatus Limnocylindria bacterium]
MPEPPDDFKRRLHDDLRAWTDASATAPRSWHDQAQLVVDGGSPGGRPGRLVLGGLGAAVVVAALAVGLAVGNLPVADPSPPSTASVPTAAPSVLRTAEPTPASPGELDLSRIAWWDELAIGFGVAPEMSTPDPNPPVQPEGYRQIRIGTLDGRVTAMLALNDDHGHSYVSGPVDGRVVVVDDRPVFSSIRLIDARTGESEYVHFSLDRITAAALSPTRPTIYYVRVNPATSEDRGIWAYSLRDGTELQIGSAPADFIVTDVPAWNLAVSPDGATLVAQYCHGEVACTTQVIDVATGTVGVSTAIGWPQEIVGRDVFGEGLNPRIWIALDLDTLRTRPAPERALTQSRSRTFGVELPPEWVATWPQVTGDSLPVGEAPRSVTLRNHRSGSELVTSPLTVSWPARGCEPLAPRVMPSGRPVGKGVRQIEDGLPRIQFGQGQDLLVSFAGPLPGLPLTDVVRHVNVRGREASLSIGYGVGVPPVWADAYVDMLYNGYPILQWDDGTCWYRVELRGLFGEALDVGEEYAARY